MKNTMKINFYRFHNGQGEDESWQNCQFTHDTDLTAFTGIKPLVTINGQPILRQHHVTYLTGKETCRAHHFAKHLAIQLLSSPSQQALEETQTSDLYDSCMSSPCRVLWIDTLHGPHIATQVYHELLAHTSDKQALHFICLDILGGQRENFFGITRRLEFLIKQLGPELVVIDDIDHFMPYCGVRNAMEFSHTVRDVINHAETAFLFIGYNHLGKKASTTGNLGKFLFNDASDIFSLSTQREVTTVRLVTSYDLRLCPDDTQFRFTIGDDNLPHEVEGNTQCKAVGDIDQSPEDCDNSNTQSSNSLETSENQQSINNSLTLPTHPDTIVEQQSVATPSTPLDPHHPRDRAVHVMRAIGS